MCQLLQRYVPYSSFFVLFLSGKTGLIAPILCVNFSVYATLSNVLQLKEFAHIVISKRSCCTMKGAFDESDTYFQQSVILMLLAPQQPTEQSINLESRKASKPNCGLHASRPLSVFPFSFPNFLKHCWLNFHQTFVFPSPIISRLYTPSLPPSFTFLSLPFPPLFLSYFLCLLHFTSTNCNHLLLFTPYQLPVLSLLLPPSLSLPPFSSLQVERHRKRTMDLATQATMVNIFYKTTSITQ